MSAAVVLERPLSWRQVGAVAEGSTLSLSAEARGRIGAARRLVEAIVSQGLRAYGVNTGVGALCDTIVAPSRQRELSRNIVLSHAVGVGAPLEKPAVRAMIAVQINNFAHGYSGVRLEVVDALAALLAKDCVPEVPARGSVGYLTHLAHISCVLIGEGHARVGGERLSGRQALRSVGLEPLVLDSKEGLSLVNGTACASGLTALALLRSERLLDWADGIAAMSFENLRGQTSAFDAAALDLRKSNALALVGQRLRAFLEGSAILEASAGRRTQDPLSLRAIPHVHGAVREEFDYAALALDAELKSVTDNPVVLGSVQAPRAQSQAHAVGAALGLRADALAVALAELAAISERRIDRLVNPLVSGLPPFLAPDAGVGSGFMIAQYIGVALTAENRRYAAASSLDGGITSGLQEDHLAHATSAALKLLAILNNAQTLLAIELLAATQAYDLVPQAPARAPRTDALYRRVRELVPLYRDDRPLSEDIELVSGLLRTQTVDA
jgi:histidine ammonia-lyase